MDDAKTTRSSPIYLKEMTKNGAEPPQTGNVLQNKHAKRQKDRKQWAIKKKNCKVKKSCERGGLLLETLSITT